MTKIYWSNVNLAETEERYQMMARRGACVALVVILAFLVLGVAGRNLRAILNWVRSIFRQAIIKKL